MADNETPTQKQGKKIDGESYIYFGIGVVFIALISLLLYWNEYHCIKTKKSLFEAQSILVQVRDISRIDPSLDGKLIHASGFADTKEVLEDDLFGASETAIHLYRRVEYYQYEEHEKTDDDGDKTYSYQKVWSTSPINSKNFYHAYSHTNHVLVKIAAKSIYANDVRFGAYRLPPFILSSIGGSTPAQIKWSESQFNEWKDVIFNNEQALLQSGDRKKRSKESGTPMVHVNGNTVFFGASPADPAIGDVRVTMTKIAPLQISIIAKVSGDTFEEFFAENGKKVTVVKRGTGSAAQMMTAAHASNNLWSWVFRVICLLLIMGIWSMMLSLSSDLFKAIPCIRSMVEAAASFTGKLFGVSWALLLIAIMWMRYKPVVGVALVVAVVAGIWYFHFIVTKRKHETNL